MTLNQKRAWRAAYQRQYYLDHKEKMQEYNREYSRKYSKTEKAKAYRRKHYLENKSHCIRKSAKWQHENQPMLNERRRMQRAASKLVALNNEYLKTVLVND